MAQNTFHSAPPPTGQPYQSVTPGDRLVEETIDIPKDIQKGDLSQSPQAIRNANADPYHYEGDAAFGGYSEDDPINRADVWANQGKSVSKTWKPEV